MHLFISESESGNVKKKSPDAKVTISMLSSLVNSPNPMQNHDFGDDLGTQRVFSSKIRISTWNAL